MIARREGVPDCFLLQRGKINFLIVARSKVAAEVAIVIDKGWVVLKSGEGAVLVASISGLVDLVGDLPDAPLGQHLHQVLQIAALKGGNCSNLSLLLSTASTAIARFQQPYACPLYALQILQAGR